MTDDLTKAEENVATAPTGVIAHRCEHQGCEKWAGFGFAKPRQVPRWFCGEHRAQGERYL